MKITYKLLIIGEIKFINGNKTKADYYKYNEHIL